jgi:hypothetical protein
MKALNKKIKDQEAEKEVITYYLYPLNQALKINNRLIKYVGISSHGDKHLEHGITRELIIKLVELLNDGYFDFSGPQNFKKNYFKDYPELGNKKYKLV